MSDSNNPLLEVNELPRFNAIKAEHVTPALNVLLAEHRQETERLLSTTDPYSWNNFAQPMEDLDERFDRMWGVVGHLNAVVNSEEWRKAYNTGLPRVSEYFTALAQDQRLYRAYQDIAACPDFSALNRAQKKIIDNTLRDLKLAGAELSGDKKKRYQTISKELASVTNQFEENLLDATHAWEMILTDELDLAGLPESVRAMAKQHAERDNKEGWKFTLEAPSYIGFVTYADNAERRQQIYQAYATRASDQGPNAGQWDNSSLILQILKLRRQQAQLLGFANYTEYALQTRMAQSVGQVMDFLYDLARRSKPYAERDWMELTTFAKKTSSVSEVNAWDVAFYSEKLRQHRYAISQEDLRPYFPVDQVLRGMFDVVHRLYGLEIAQIEGIDVWHPEVRVYEIRGPDAAVRGRFFVDLYARPHKRGGAWMDECVSRKRIDGEVQIPSAYLVCNLAPPVGDKPALFSHDEVTTLFHEFGHGLHHMLTQVDYVSVAGINGISWDAVELPSQFMENWCWEREALDLFARHYETGETLPEELYQKMIAAKNFQSGMQFVRQLEFSLFDMKLYSEFDPDGEKTVQQLLDEVRREVAVIIAPSYNRFQNGFSHIFSGGYAAGYYSYKWAEVLSADAFSKFEERGIFDAKTGREFLSSVLEQGGTREPMELFVAFRGRPPKIDALLRHSGLAA